MDLLWLESLMAFLKSHEPSTRRPSRKYRGSRCSPRECKNLLLPSPPWLGSIEAWLKTHEPLAREPSRQHRAVAVLLACVKIYYIPHPYGFDSLCFGSIVALLI